MAHRTKISGTAYEIKGGRTKVGGTGYGISKGRTKVGGTGYDISFSNLITVTLEVWKTSGKTIYSSQTQNVVFQAEPEMTYADLAASSEYNTVPIPDSGGNTLTIANIGGYVGARVKQSNGAVFNIVHESWEASDFELEDGMTICLTGYDGQVTITDMDFTKWTFVQ
jgi:hypothetical protein